jgi:hypothetical protein
MPAYTFTGRFTAPFHSAAYKTQNLQTCAPYVTGSTLRGAVLMHLLLKYCSHRAELAQEGVGYHARCDEPSCSWLRTVFAPPSDAEATRFTFGQFAPEESGVQMRTRLGLARETRTSGAGPEGTGSLLSLEARWGRFTFHVQVPDAVPMGDLYRAVRQAGEHGVGGFRANGWGRFEVEEWNLYQAPSLPATEKLSLALVTPYILPKDTTEPFTELVRADLTALLGEGVVTHVEAQVGGRLYLRRWNYEGGDRPVNAVAVDPAGTLVHVTFAAALAESQRQALAWATWGLGPWSDCGYGALRRILEGE